MGFDFLSSYNALSLRLSRQSLYLLQGNLMKREKDLERLICDKDRTITEQQRVIRRLLGRSASSGHTPGPASPTPDSSTSTLATITDTGDPGDAGADHHDVLVCFRV